MSRRKNDPLREITSEEHQALVQLSRSQAAPAVEVTRAKLLLAVAPATPSLNSSPASTPRAWRR